MDACFQFLWYMSRSEIAGSDSKCVPNFLRDHHPAFHNSCTILHPRPQCLGFYFLHILANPLVVVVVVVVLGFTVILMSVDWYLIVVLISDLFYFQLFMMENFRHLQGK